MSISAKIVALQTEMDMVIKGLENEEDKSSEKYEVLCRNICDLSMALNTLFDVMYMEKMVCTPDNCKSDNE